VIATTRMISVLSGNVIAFKLNRSSPLAGRRGELLIMKGKTMQENNQEEASSIEEYVPFGFHIVESNDPEHGEFRVKNGTISMYDANDEQYIPVAPNWDGAQDIWGTSKNYETVEASAHDWISSVTTNPQGEQRNEFFAQDAWQISDGWTEAHAIGLPGVMVFEKDWIVKAHNRVCDS